MDGIPAGQRAYLVALSDTLRELLGRNLIGVYVYGSMALGGFHPQTSDIDVLAVCERSLSNQEKALVAARLLAPEPPAKGLEFSLLTRRAAKARVRAVPFELHVAREPEVHVTDGSNRDGDPDMILAIEISRQAGIVLHGPPADEIFPAIPDDWLLQMCDRELQWIEEHPSQAPDESSVLQACRAWRYADERVLSSKIAGGRWALKRGAPERDLIQAAMARKSGDMSSRVEHGPAMSLVAKVRDLIDRKREAI